MNNKNLYKSRTEVVLKKIPLKIEPYFMRKYPGYRKKGGVNLRNDITYKKTRKKKSNVYST